MDKKKPCRACGEKEQRVMFATLRGKHICSIGCRNISCDEQSVIAYGRSKAQAEERAWRKWNWRNDV